MKILGGELKKKYKFIKNTNNIYIKKHKKERKKMMKFKNSVKGITLIALVVTIALNC